MKTHEHMSMVPSEIEAASPERVASDEINVFQRTATELGRKAVVNAMDAHVAEITNVWRRQAEQAVNSQNYSKTPQGYRNALTGVGFKAERQLRKDPYMAELQEAREAIAHPEIDRLPVAYISVAENIPVTVHEIPDLEHGHEK